MVPELQLRRTDRRTAAFRLDGHLALAVPNWETFGGQAIALAVVLGSYAGAQYVRVWRPRRRGLAAARAATAPPELPADVAVAAAASPVAIA